LPNDAWKAQPEIDAFYVRCWSWEIGGLLAIVDQTETIAFLNYILYDMLGTQSNPAHWRNKETEQMTTIYRKARKESDE
jgi:hypothetical protein